MDRVALPGTVERISRLTLGTAGFGGWTDEQTAIRLVHRALDEGLNVIDTAASYGASEEIVGKALVGRRESVLVATKVSPSVDGPPGHVFSAGDLVASAERSLRRLRTDRIDIFQLHDPLVETPAGEIVAAIDRLIADGKVRFFGVCNHDVAQLAALLTLAKGAPRCRLVTVQNQYNLLDCSLGEAVFPFCRRRGIGFLAWSPLAGGLLGGRYGASSPAPYRSRYAGGYWLPHEDPISVLPKVDGFRAAAADLGLSLPQMALGWLLAETSVTSLVIGPRSAFQLDLYLTAATMRHI
ncbi:MAG: aldo/keto reductase [Sphingomonas sp.]